MSKSVILANWIMAPDGTMIPSFDRHDFRKHVSIDSIERFHPEGEEEPEEFGGDAWVEWNRQLQTKIISSRTCSVDGGTNYLKRSGKYTEMTVYEDDPFEVIRRFFCRGGHGVDGKEELTWVPLFKMDKDWLEACIEYTPLNYYNKYYQMELDYREDKEK